jgi:hypothetical protein
MTILADLFNPSFFIILGIVALLIALVVVYFESKMREQNHKIASMLSLVSTLAEDMNVVKMGLNHLAITSLNGGSQMEIPQNTPFPPQNLGTHINDESQLNLIEVSDDESEEDEDEEEIMDDSELEEVEEDDEETSSESNDEDEDEDDNGENIKVIKLNISENTEDDANSYEETNNLDFEPDDDLAVLEDMDDIPEISEDYAEELLSLKYDEVKEEKALAKDNLQLEETVVPSASDLKTIAINLGDESHSEHIEYKKLQLPKLRSIAVEKGLTNNSESIKLKKPELLKLLGVFE